MNRVALAVVVVLFAALPLQGQQPPTAFVSILDRGGEPLTDLLPSQVRMVVGTAECTSVALQPITWPTKLIVLVDNGQALSESLSSLREGLRRFLFEVPEGMEVSLVTLAPQPRWVVRPTSERRDFWLALDRLTADRGAPKFLEGLAETANRIEKEVADSFSTILIVTSDAADGSGGDGQRTFDRLRAQLKRRPVTVHVLTLAVASAQTPSTVSRADAATAPVMGPSLATAGNTALGLPGSPVAERASTMTFRPVGGIQTQVGLALTKETGGRYDNVAVVSTLLTLLPEYGRRIARSYALQSSQYRVTCEEAPASGQVSVFTSHPRAAAVWLSRDGRVP